MVENDSSHHAYIITFLTTSVDRLLQITYPCDMFNSSHSHLDCAWSEDDHILSKLVLVSVSAKLIYLLNDDVIKWKHFSRYWPFVRGIHRSPRNSPHKDQWRGALMFSLICAWINGWVNNREAGDLRRPLWRHCNGIYTFQNMTKKLHAICVSLTTHILSSRPFVWSAFSIEVIQTAM